MTKSADLQEAIIALSAPVISAAEKDDWERVASMQDERFAQLQRLLLNAEKNQSPQDMLALVAISKQEDQRLMALVEKGKAQLKQQMGERTKNRKAINKYQNSPKA